MNELSTIKTESFSLVPKTLQEAMDFANMIAKSDLVPKDFKGRPENVVIAIQMGLEIGLPPMQALQGIAVINGRPSVWGDALIAVCRGNPRCEYIAETFDEQTMTATCKAKRRGEPEQIRTFSQKDAETAKLWQKDIWKSYPKRMLQMRARAFCLRDVFPDSLRGIAVAEEVQDYIDMGAAEREPEPPQSKEPAPLPEYPADKFSANIHEWHKRIKAGKDTAADIISKIESSYTLSKDQKTAIQEVEPTQGE